MTKAVTASKTTALGHFPVRTSFFARAFSTTNASRTSQPKASAVTNQATARLVGDQIRRARRLATDRVKPGQRLRLMTVNMYLAAHAARIAKSREAHYGVRTLDQTVGFRGAGFGRDKSPRNAQYLRRQPGIPAPVELHRTIVRAKG